MPQKQSTWARLIRGRDPLWTLKRHGVPATLRWLRRSAPYYLWLYVTPGGRRELRFDQLHAVETDGMMPRWEMGDVGPNLQYAVQYLPTKPKKFHALLTSLHINYPDFTFIDIGSGKGRTLLLAQQYHFHRSIGVEFVPRLCEIARRNLETCGCSAEVVCMDATQYTFPNDPLVIYMCNPFHTKPMREMVANLETSLAPSPRPIYILYWNAFYPEALNESPFFTLVAHRREEFAVFKSLPDESSSHLT